MAVLTQELLLHAERCMQHEDVSKNIMLAGLNWRENGRNVNSFRAGLCGQRHGLAVNWADRPRTSADERDVACSPCCRDCVWAVQCLVVFFIDLSFLREQST